MNYSDTINRLERKINLAAASNTVQDRFYRGKIRIRDLGIGLPPQMSRLNAVMGWPRICVDSVANRLILRGISHPDRDLNEVVRRVMHENNLVNELRFPVVDSLVYGVGFISVHAGRVELGEPRVIVSAESPNSMTGTFDGRTRRLVEAVKFDRDENGRVTGGVLFLPNETVFFDRDREVVSVDAHNLGRVPVVPLVNNARTSAVWGRSDITPDIKYCTEAAVRTIVGAEVSREYFASPQRWILGASESLFEDEDGNPTDAWQAYQGRWLALERDEEGQMPQVGTFAANSPEPYLALLESLSRQCAAGADLPAEYFGLVNKSLPSSADAIRASEQKLIQKVQAKTGNIVSAFQQVFELVFMFSGVEPGEPVKVFLANPATPTPASTADMLCKLVQVGALSPTSTTVYELMGLSPDEVEVARAELAKANKTRSLAVLAGLADAAREDTGVADANARTRPVGGDEGAS